MNAWLSLVREAEHENKCQFSFFLQFAAVLLLSKYHTLEIRVSMSVKIRDKISWGYAN
jgi:hypothetical protein